MSDEIEINLDAEMADFATKLARRLKINLYRLGAIDSKTLFSSVNAVTVKRNTSNAGYLELRFAEYGRFIDMGVGRGYKKGSKESLGKKEFAKKRNALGQLHNANRQRINWYSGLAYKMVYSELKYAITAKNKNAIVTAFKTLEHELAKR